MKPKKILGVGFSGMIGGHCIKEILKKTDWEITVLDVRKPEISGPRVRFIEHNLENPIGDIGQYDYVWHIAAATDIEESIKDPLKHVKANVVGTTNLLLWAKDQKLEKFLYLGSERIFGSNRKSKEWDNYNSESPYAATKAGAEEMCMAFYYSYGVPVVIAHTMSVFDRSHKFLKYCIEGILADRELEIYNVTRNYLYAGCLAEALLFITHVGSVGDKYNAPGQEVSNPLIAKMVGEALHKVPKIIIKESQLKNYYLDVGKLKNMGFEYSMTLQKSINEMVK